MKLKPILVLALFLLIPTLAHATDALGYICCSKHQRKKDAHLNTDNSGWYYYHGNEDRVLVLGDYTNSFSRDAKFITYGPVWRVSKNVTFAFPMGVITGYVGHPSPVAVPTFRLYDRVQISFVPGIVYALSFDLVHF